VAGGISGDEGIHVVTLSGNAPVHPENSVINYTAPSVTGADYILVTDRSGNQEKVNIEVSSGDFFVSPSNVVRYRGEKTVFKAVKGMGDKIIWSTGQGDIVMSDDSRSMTYTAPEITGEYPVTAVDSAGKSAIAVVHVVNEKVRITPREVYAGPGDPVKFRVFGGAGGYDVKIIDGILSPILEDGTFEYITPHIAGEYFVTVLDRSGAWTQTTVQVAGNSEFEPVFPGGVVYDIVNQFQGGGDCSFVETPDDFAINFTLNYNPEVPLPVDLYLRWKLPGGRYLYVKKWDGVTDFKSWGLNLTPERESFVGVFGLGSGMFVNFRLYGDLFAPVSKSELMALDGPGVYRFEFLLKPSGSLSRDEYTMPVHLRVVE